MLKNHPTRADRKERKKRRARAELSANVVTTYRSGLAKAPESELKAVRKRKASRRAKISAKRQPKAEPFFIGGSGK